MNLKSKLGKEVIIFDGAMGTVLQKQGLEIGKFPEKLNLEAPRRIIEIHKSYLKAGADIITTNTFGANSLKLKGSQYSVEQIISAAVKNAKVAVAESGFAANIALSLGPLGELIEPNGKLSFKKAYKLYQKQVLLGVENGIDLIQIETISQLAAARAAVLAAKENSDLAIFCTLTFTESGRTFTGCNLRSMISVLEGLGVDALGINCSLGPKKAEVLVEKILKYSKLPVILQANAGLPVIEAGKTNYKISPATYYTPLARLYQQGLAIIGGCCGTTPEYISLIADKLKGKKIKKRKIIKKDLVCSAVEYSDLSGINVVGERINPTGKAEFKENLKKGNLDYLLKIALAEIEAGADILDINLGLPEIDEKKMMLKFIQELQQNITKPLQIDSTNLEVIETALRNYNGIAIINSVTGKKDSLEKVLTVAKKYGAFVIGLTIDENGIPETAAGRLKIAEKIVNKAVELKISKDKIIIDCLALTVSAQPKSIEKTLTALKLVQEKLEVKTILGISNISFGLPARSILNRSFLTMALAQGLNLAIMDPNDPEMMATVKAVSVLKNLDQGAEKYIDFISHFKNQSKTIKTKKQKSEKKDLKELIISGLKDETKKLTKELLLEKEPLEIIDQHLIPALNLVGEKYEKGELFLPKLLKTAATVKESFSVLKMQMKQENNQKLAKGKILLATVEGDVHDIGKNIVKVLLENYNYQVIDLGKNIETEKIVNTVLKNEIKLLGLSALMTTTVKNMQKVIKAVKKAAPNCKIMVGGAVLTADYAKMIKADFYAQDAQTAVEIANNLFLD